MTFLTASCWRPAARVRRDKPWRPILEGVERERALDVVERIAQGLRDRSPTAERDGSLANGHAGLALLFHYLDKARPGRGHGESAAECLSNAITSLESAALPPSLFGGFTGIAWAVAHWQAQSGGEIDEQFAAVDEALLELLSTQPWADRYDLVSGLVGFGVYALSRLPHAAAKQGLRLVVERLNETREERAPGAAWLTAPDSLPPDRRRVSPQGEYDLGVAHGVPGVIGVLSQACAAGVAEATARPLLKKAVEWLLIQRIEGHPGAQFGYDVRPNEPPSPARSAWCYGDPGVAAVLWMAGRCAKHAPWQRAALEIAVCAAARPLAETSVKDAGLCHGAAGLAHIYNRLYQASDDRRLLQAAHFWLEQTLAYQQPAGGIGGYLAWQTADGMGGAWCDKEGFLEGAAGVGLALLAAADVHEPAWDQVLLLSSAIHL